MDDDEPITRTTEQARAGETPGIVRWVLGISLTLTIIALALVVFNYAHSDRPLVQASATAMP